MSLLLSPISLMGPLSLGCFYLMEPFTHSCGPSGDRLEGPWREVYAGSHLLIGGCPESRCIPLLAATPGDPEYRRIAWTGLER